MQEIAAMDRIWDPLRRKFVTATPEERVRQWFVNVLATSASVPYHMMRSEAGFLFGEKKYRADIVVYGRNGLPLCVVECKRPDVEIDARVAEQAMRYNSVLDVKFLMLTNGNLTYIYILEHGTFVPFDHIPSYEEMLCRQ